MSIGGAGMIETRYKNFSQSWFSGGQVYFYGDVDVYALLAHPWGEPDGDDLPLPVVTPRGLPSDLSLMTLHEVGWIPNAEAAREKEPRCITPKQAKKFKPLSLGYVLDPKEWRCLTWLTTKEVALAASSYRKRSKGRRSGELEGILGMMRGYESTKIMETRLVLWFQ
jgi:hypothetical protein